MSPRIAIVDANLIDGLDRRLQQSGLSSTAIGDVSSLNSWLSEHGATVLLLNLELKKEAVNPIRTVKTERRKANQQISWCLNSALFKLTSPSGMAISLSHNECCVLQAASSANGQLVCRKTLINALGQNVMHYDERRLEALISRLRRKLVSGVAEDFPIRGVKGRGYLFGVNLRDERK
ncbi:MAG: winged helix-turn-helix domain-containing protein [Gallionellaceae bacterium]